MTDQLVAILVAPAGGDPGGRPVLGGTGTLVGTRSVLVHPPLSRRLHDGSGPVPVRVAVCGWDPEAVQLIDVRGVHVSDQALGGAAGDDTEPVVGLDLASPSARAGIADFDSDSQALTHLRDPFGAGSPWRSSRPGTVPATVVGGTDVPPPPPGDPGDPCDPRAPRDPRDPDGPPPPGGPPGDGEDWYPPPPSPSILCRFLGIFCR